MALPGSILLRFRDNLEKGKVCRFNGPYVSLSQLNFNRAKEVD